ncbi:hypothetical protein JHK82_030974 [Glycine max]|nr:hypothetical protein JHK85_031620 [Glycine max]KAG5124237.1 hypothetical protein JHK82_030974 [Glycine max]KAG5145657.1 hypothetical protein JHK84_031200 [Glycine max]
MAPLKSLEKEYPLIDSNFQTFCASHGIFSGSGIDQLISIIDALHPPLLNGLQLLEDAQCFVHWM